ncbi:MAG TPA: ABC transporter ATP-binding protein [Alphaproteobacteria bacterium]|nr:ABC transporter ATP-binding protein [Alphaproteobacteria bacterium]
MTLAIENGSIVYPGPRGGSVHALSDVSLEIAEGALVVALGASGCGKTSLLNVLAGFQPLTGGRASFDGRPIAGPGRDRGVVFQKDTLYPWLNVRDNVAFGLRLQGWKAAARHPRAAELLDLVGLGDFAGAAIHQLSGGMRQRVGLARALATDPRVLLMDEPFGALDSLTRESMQELLAAIWARTRKSVFLITHSIEEALFLGTEIVVMSPRPGRIVRRYRTDFVRRVAAGDSPGAVRADRQFIALREEIRTLIHETGKQNHDRSVAVAA